MNSKTIYRPINSYTGEIRLLVLAGQTKENSTPEYKFKSVHLRDEPTFEALSYVWGDPTPVISVVVDGISSKVPKNLGIVLPYLTGRLEECPLWVDALCINQDDTEEKSAQIVLMGRIFSQAKNVLSWLGERPGSSLVDRRWHRFEQLLLQQKHPPLFQAASSSAQTPRHTDKVLGPVNQIDDKTTISLNGLAMVKGHAMSAFRSILKRPYFTRLWVVQEVVLAKRPIAMVGNIYFDLKQLLGIAGRDMGERQVKTDWAALRVIMNAHSRGEPFSVMELLDLTGGHQVTDPRDRVVALLGIARDADKINFNTGALYHLDTRDFISAFAAAYVDSLQVYNGGIGEWNMVKAAMKKYRSEINDESLWEVDQARLAMRLMSAIEHSVMAGKAISWSYEDKYELHRVAQQIQHLQADF